jgi:choline dehydrogenase
MDSQIKEYDFIIVGGGTAGLVVAARLSEDPAVSVAVIEAGKNLIEDENILRPGLINTMYGDPKYDWRFKTEPQVDHLTRSVPSSSSLITCQACLNGRSITMPRGKVLGGTSALHFLMVSYATRVDLDNWEKLGNQGWNFDSMAPYYRKFEKFTQHSSKATDALHTSHIDPALYGTEGNVHTTIPENHWPLAEAWPPTFQNLGLGLKGDHKTGISAGGYSSIAYVDPRTSTRSYSATAYYVPVASRSNLTLISDALVDRIDLEGKKSDVIAKGVSYIVAGKAFKINAKKEVVLSAGAFGSPQILELSGIGSPSLLSSYNIEVIIGNENVGENLQDHALVPYSAEVADGELTMESFRNPAIIQKAFQDYSERKTGLLATPAINSSAFIPYSAVLSDFEKSSAAAEIDTIISQGSKGLRPGLSKQYQLIRDDLLNENETSMQLLFILAGVPERKFYGAESPHPGNYITIASCLQHPFSRGDVHIKSSDPSVYPAVNPRYLSHPMDVKMFGKHLLHVPKIFTTDPLASRLKDQGKALQPGYPVLTQENVEQFVVDNLDTEHHPIATCSMLPREDGGVVDEKLIVYGTKNLRVVDASAIPLQSAANTTSTVYALTEKAADLIKEKWGLKL